MTRLYPGRMSSYHDLQVMGIRGQRRSVDVKCHGKRKHAMAVFGLANDVACVSCDRKLGCDAPDASLIIFREQTMSNQTGISEMILVGFPGITEDYNTLISAMMFLVYITSLTANGSVICLVTLNTHLHQPMYLIIANLAASNLLFDTATLPKLIAKYWFGAYSMPFNVCVFQMFCVHYFGSLDSFLLMVMAVDRYMSICHPLRYAAIITNKTVFITCGICWVCFATSTNATIAAQASQLDRCGANKIYTLFCTHAAISALACSDATYMRRVAFVCAMVVLLVPLGVILLSYTLIIAVITARSDSWRRAFYTCTTHLLVVGLYYVPRIFVYIVTNIPLVIIKPNINALLLFLYSVVPHMANPIIYFLRTNEIRQTLHKVLKKTRHRLTLGVLYKN
ncbi:olfactory receptor-like protein DTMT [Pseudophryne corroboree]|uniref:olfactory receptor-like protein DTMT n=1 Tax=Pseudophryne corroboree TaxID=495146 RepID=UPI0030813520